MASEKYITHNEPIDLLNTIILTEEKKPNWAELAKRKWLRRKWRSSGKTGAIASCMICVRPIHNKESYYVRPAYTDGKDWMCVRCYRDMRKAVGGDMSNKYGH